MTAFEITPFLIPGEPAPMLTLVTGCVCLRGHGHQHEPAAYFNGQEMRMLVNERCECGQNILPLIPNWGVMSLS